MSIEYKKAYQVSECASSYGMTATVKESKAITLQEVAWEWLSSTTHIIRRSTYQKYESLIRVHIAKDMIGQTPISDLTGKMLHGFAEQKLVQEQLTPKTVNDILTVIKAIMVYAEDTFGIAKVKFQYIREPRKEMRVLSIQEQQQLEEYLWKDIDLCKFGVLLALYTGLRIGELCALLWEDIHDGNIYVNKTLYRIKNGTKTCVGSFEPKTISSNRVIPLPSFFLPAVEAFRAEGPVLLNSRGRQVEPRLMQMIFSRFINECGIPKTNFHALRHTFATRCVEAGFDVKSLSEILGHSDVKTTLNKYVHSSFEQKRKNMELLHSMATSRQK